MARLVVEVLKNKPEAEARAEAYRQVGCKIQAISPYSVVSWVNSTGTPASDTAADPIDEEVWVVLAAR